MMSLDYYQENAVKTAIYTRTFPPVYPVLGLVGEAGEVAEKIKKSIRDGEVLNSEEVAKELGDVLWYVAALAGDLGYSLSHIAGMNLAKLADRQARNVLKGSGDNR